MAQVWTRKVNTYSDADIDVVTDAVNALLLSLSTMNNAVPPGSQVPIVFDVPAVTMWGDGSQTSAMVSYNQLTVTP